MSNFVINRLSSISVKLFLWFWLIAISSIAATHFISLQLAKNSFTIPLHDNDIKKLNKIANKIKPKSLINAISYADKLSPKYGEKLFLRNLNDNKIYTSNKKSLNKSINKINAHINNTEEEKTVSVIFSQIRLRLTGPILVTIEQQPFHLYLASKHRSHRFGMILKQLPTWARILIPVSISFIFCWLLARTLSRPIVDIQEMTAKFGNGLLSARVVKATQRNDELGDLGKSFNLMAKKLEHNVHAQQRLLADVSHELRSPMTRLQIALGLAKNTLGQKEISPDELNKHLDRCEKEVSQLNDMISDVLSLSRLENTIPSLNYEKIELKSLLEILIQDCQYIANEKKSIILLEDCPNLLINVDIKLISSALSNIINNAVNYSPVNSNIILSCELTKQNVTISITDTGTGVPEQELSKLFQPFYRVSQARERKSGGTGLGLAIAKQAINALQGSITAKNNNGNGLTVTINLPLAPQISS